MEAKINTAHIQYELVIRVQEYINCHLFDDLDSEKLSQIVCISKYHFRRLFKAVCGDSLGNYIQRLRLEYIAFKLISTNISVPEILSQINYQNKHTLSRAFKNYFNCSIPEFRKDIQMPVLKARIQYRLNQVLKECLIHGLHI